MAEQNEAGEQEVTVQLQPGNIITPGSPAESATPQPAASPAQILPSGLPRSESERVVGGITNEIPPPPPLAPLPAAPEPPAIPVEKPAPAPPPESAPLPSPDPVPLSPVAESAETTATTEDNGMTWIAPEFIAHEKSSAWYMLLMILAIVFAAVIFLLTKDLISCGAVIAAAIFFGIYAGRHPRQIQYLASEDGVGVGRKSYSYDEFRSFSVVPEGLLSSVVFMPLKRFAPPTTLYFSPLEENKIVDVVSAHLPYTENQPDTLDKVLRHIRF